MKTANALLTIGEAARRSGVATSALRFYESRGLIRSIRVQGNHRRYPRMTLRRIAIIRVAQTLGLSLAEIATAFESLPEQRNPTRKDWERLSTLWGRPVRLSALVTSSWTGISARHWVPLTQPLIGARRQSPARTAGTGT